MMRKTHARRYSDCEPVTLLGRKVWIAQRGGYGGSFKEIWIHTNPFKPADLYFKGSSLTEGTEAENRKFLEDLCRETLEGSRKMSARLEALWDNDLAERAAEAAALAEWQASYDPDWGDDR